MGTEILQPQDLLVQRFHVHTPAFHGQRNFPGNGDLTKLIVNRRPNNNYRKKSPKADKRKSSETKRVIQGGDARRKDGGGPAMDHVTILRRGQSYDSLAAKIDRSRPPATKLPADDMAVLGTGRIGPNSPEMFPKQIQLTPPPLTDVYAGSAFFLSPSPRSLPFPSFTNKKQQDCVKINPSADPATRDLRRLLRLE